MKKALSVSVILLSMSLMTGCVVAPDQYSATVYAPRPLYYPTDTNTYVVGNYEDAYYVGNPYPYYAPNDFSINYYGGYGYRHAGHGGWRGNGNWHGGQHGDSGHHH